MNFLSEHNRILQGSLVYTAGGDVYNSGWEYTPSGEISGYSGSAIYTGEGCQCDSAAVVDSAFNKSTAWANEQNYLTAHQDVTNLPYVQNSAIEVSPQNLISSISGSGFYAETANFAYNAEHADSADYVESAHSALYAQSANSALNAEVSNVSYTALTANFIDGGWEYDENSAITSYNGSAFGDNTPYSAGANIDITNHVVSGKDWTDTIQAASSYAVDQATAQIPAVTGLPYVENSALAYTPGGHLVSSISGNGLYALSAVGAFTAETANYTYVAETANYVEGGWEFNTANQITGYSGSAFAVTGGGSTGGKVYTGIAPIVVNNSTDKISANTIPLSAGQGISLAEINNKVLISTTNANNLMFSNVQGGADNSIATAEYTLERVNEPSTINWYKLKMTNATGNTASFSLIPSDIASGYLYCYGNGALGTLSVKDSDIWVYAFDTATNSINTNKAGTYKEVHLSTPRNYDGYPEYSAILDGQVFVMESSCYCDFIRQDIEGTARWCIKISGEYDY